MKTLYEDIMQGVKGHFYRLQVQHPNDKRAVRIDSIFAPFGENVKPVLSVKGINYKDGKFIEENEENYIPFTDLKSMNRVSNEEEKEIKSKLEKSLKKNKANLSSKKPKIKDKKALKNYLNKHFRDKQP